MERSSDNPSSFSPELEELSREELIDKFRALNNRLARELVNPDTETEALRDLQADTSEVNLVSSLLSRLQSKK